MDKQYISAVNQRTPRPRSKRLREQGIGGCVNATIVTGFQAELDKTDFASKFAAEMAKWFVRDTANKGIYPAEYDGENVGLYSKTFVSALGVSNVSGGGGGASALFELADVLANSDNTGVQGAVAGSLLGYNGTHWEAVAQSSIVPDLTGYATEVWVEAKGYATTSAMNAALSGKADKTISISAGTGLTGGGNLTTNRTISLKPATTSALGGIIVGDRLSVDANGKLNATYTYTHPATHPASIIDTDATHRWMTDAMISKLNGIEAGANKYVLPTASA